MTTTTQTLVYSLAFKGLYGRNRKPKFHVVEIASDIALDAPLSVDTLQGLAKHELRLMNAKRGGWDVTKDTETIEDCGNGVVMRTRMLRFNRPSDYLLSGAV